MFGIANIEKSLGFAGIPFTMPLLARREHSGMTDDINIASL
jgi:hypothetical protein